MKKWLSAILLCVGILLAMLPIRASAAAATTVTITGGSVYYAHQQLCDVCQKHCDNRR